MFKNSPRVYRSDEPTVLRMPLLLSGHVPDEAAQRSMTSGCSYKDGMRLVPI